MSPSRLLVLGPIALLLPGGFTLIRGRSLRSSVLFIGWLTSLVAAALGPMSLAAAGLVEAFIPVGQGPILSIHLALWRPQR